MEELRKALFTDIQHIKQEKKHHIGVILVSVSPIHAFGSKKQKNGGTYSTAMRIVFKPCILLTDRVETAKGI